MEVGAFEQGLEGHIDLMQFSRKQPIKTGKLEVCMTIRE